MALNNLELYLYQEVISKAKYERLTGKKTIYLKDYASLKLSQKKKDLLRQICQENDIFLEELPERMRVEETQELLKKYNEIKRRIKSNQSDSTNELLNRCLYEIKEKVTLGHMQVVYDLISKNQSDKFPNIEPEDIYQIGYETLLELIDTYNETKDSTFLYYINRYIMYRINVKILVESKGIKSSQAYKLKKINSYIEKLNITNIDYQALEKLSALTGWSIKIIKRILLIRTRLENTELDSYDEDNLPQELIYTSFEEDLIYNILKNNNHIEKVLSVLTPIQLQVIRLYYGFEDGKTHTYDEIATILNKYSREGIRKIINGSIIKISNSIFFNYLSSIYGTSNDSLPLDKSKEETCKQKSPDLNLSIVQQHELLLSSFPNEILQELLQELNIPSIYIEVLNLYYGLNDGQEYTCEEISEILNLKITQVKKIKNSATNIILKYLARRLNHNFTGNYLEYMSNYYLNNKTKKKIKGRL